MKYLLDTHTFIWLDGSSKNLSPKALALIGDKTNSLMLSVASLWEIQIKLLLRKLTLSGSLADVIAVQQATNGIQLLPIEVTHILELAQLPNHHKDPFDRLLIAQARTEQATLISHDPQFARYPVNVVW